jgi:phosphohistidine phosphatase
VDIYLIRHADAVPLGEQGITEDADRPLTEAGENEARKLGDALRQRGIALGHVVISPLLRARQTAEIMLGAWPAPQPQVHVCEDLVPEGKPRKVARFLQKLGAGDVGLVGHMPQLGNMTGWLIGSKKANIDLAKTGVAYVACADRLRKNCGTLLWLITPGWFAS